MKQSVTTSITEPQSSLSAEVQRLQSLARRVGPAKRHRLGSSDHRRLVHGEVRRPLPKQDAEDRAELLGEDAVPIVPQVSRGRAEKLDSCSRIDRSSVINFGPFEIGLESTFHELDSTSIFSVYVRRVIFDSKS